VQLVAESGLQKPSVLELMVLLVVAGEPHAPSTWWSRWGVPTCNWRWF